MFTYNSYTFQTFSGDSDLSQQSEKVYNNYSGSTLARVSNELTDYRENGARDFPEQFYENSQLFGKVIVAMIAIPHYHIGYSIVIITRNRG